uniref:Uncharacterized protein n=1 Tax=Ailuropoda melanoleuca TaxID=9646 RepID=A0A7N5KNT7_AILME
MTPSGYLGLNHTTTFCSSSRILSSWFPWVIQLGCTLCGRPNNSILSVPEDSLNHDVDFIWFMTGRMNLTYSHITIQTLVEALGISFDTNKPMFLPMVQPVTCTACPNEELQLICLHPDTFSLYTFS